MTSTNFKSLKKANCHLHITGSLNPSDLRKLSNISGVNIAEFEPLEKHLNFYDPRIWSAAKNITSTPVGLTEAIKLILTREQEDGVIYLELTINPAGMIRRGMEPSVIAESILEAFQFGESIGIEGKVKFGINRKDGPESVPMVKEAFSAAPDHLKICIDLNGDERKFRTLDFLDAFLKLKSENIPICLHIGEYMDCGSEALEKIMSMTPLRIAHAISVAKNDYLLSMIQEKNIVIEMSPLSNLRTGAFSEGSNHPIKKFITLGLPVVVGSDDPAFFGTTVTSEYEYLAQIGVATVDIEKINKRGLALDGYSNQDGTADKCFGK